MAQNEFFSRLAERAIAADPANQWSRQRQSAYSRYIELGDLAASRDVIAGSEAAGLAPFQVFLYLGDWRAAGEAVYDVPERLRSAYHDWLAAEAVRDLALKTGDFPRAIRFIESGGLGVAAPYELNLFNIYVAVPFAHLLRANGQRAESEKVLDEALAWVNRKRDPARDSMVWWPLRRLRADMLALQGNRDAAVAELAEAFQSGIGKQGAIDLSFFELAQTGLHLAAENHRSDVGAQPPDQGLATQ